METDGIGAHKFSADSRMSFQELFDFAYGKLVPLLEGLAREFGEARFLEALERVACDCARKAGQQAARGLPRNDLAAFVGSAEEPSRFARHVLTRATVEDTAEAFELRVTECLWAKTLRDMGASDIGYRLLCQTDYADCQGFNPNIVLVRSKTLMQGDDCCDHRFLWNGP